MDSRIEVVKAALISGLTTNGQGDKARRLVLELQDGSDGGGYGLVAIESIIDRALSPLTAEPAPCEDKSKIDDGKVVSEYLKTTREWYEQGHAEIGDEMSGIESEGDRAEEALERIISASQNASRCDQEARADKRSWHEDAVDILQDAIDTVCNNHPDYEMPSRKTTRLEWIMRAKVFIHDHPIAAILQGTEPANVSEDVERDDETIQRALIYMSGAIDDIADHLANEAEQAKDRLVSRIKEGNRG